MSVLRHAVTIALALGMVTAAHAGTATLTSPPLGTAAPYQLECFARNVGKKDVTVDIGFHLLANDMPFGPPATFNLAPGQGQFFSLNTGGAFYTCVVSFEGSKKAVRASWQLKDGSGAVMAAGESR